MNILRVTENIISHNTKIKEYPNGDLKITVASAPVFKEKGFELAKDEERIPKPKDMDNPSRDDSIRRSIDKVFDIVRMNDFELFVTLTLDGEKIDRADKENIYSKAKNFLDNLARRYSLKYLLIPEYHKKNNAIHFHGFFSGNITLVDSGTVKATGYDKPIKVETAKRKGIPLEECKTVYNLPQWKWGYSTAVKTDGNNLAMSKYITKYVTKDIQKIFGKFYLAGGRELKRDVPFHLCDTDFESFEADNESYCSAIDVRFKYSELVKGVSDDVQ